MSNVIIENKGKRATGLPVKGQIVEIAPGETVEIDAKDFAALKGRKSVSAKLAAGELVEVKAAAPAKAAKGGKSEE